MITDNLVFDRKNVRVETRITHSSVLLAIFLALCTC
jgi:hypothetical protein